MAAKSLRIIGIDYVAIFIAVAGLLSLGMIMVLSASSVNSMQTTGNSYSIFLKQFLFMIIGLGLAYIATRISKENWEVLARFSFIFGALALMAALVDRKSTRLNSSHIPLSRMPSSA